MFSEILNPEQKNRPLAKSNFNPMAGRGFYNYSLPAFLTAANPKSAATPSPAASRPLRPKPKCSDKATRPTRNTELKSNAHSNFSTFPSSKLFSSHPAKLLAAPAKNGMPNNSQTILNNTSVITEIRSFVYISFSFLL